MLREAKNYQEILGYITEAMLTCLESTIKVRVKYSDSGIELQDSMDLIMEFENKKFEEANIGKAFAELSMRDCYGYEPVSFDLTIH